MTKIEQIQSAIAQAEDCVSQLTYREFEVGGFTSPKIRHLLNNLGALSTEYLEIGVHRGSTLVATCHGNTLKRFTGVDNFSEFDDGTVKKELEDNVLNRISGPGSLFFEDCFRSDLPGRMGGFYDMYLYDGAHDYASQKQAISHFLPVLADEFILCVDDTDWSDVINGTNDGIYEAGLKIVWDKLLEGKDGWHNGFYVALIKKVK